VILGPRASLALRRADRFSRPLAVFACLLLAAVPPLVAAPVPLRVALEPGLLAVLTPDDELYLEALPKRGEALINFAARLCVAKDRPALSALAAANGGHRQLLVGVRYRVPYALLQPELKVRVMRGVFPEDRALSEGWRHRVRATKGKAETLTRLAEWLGDGAAAGRELAELVHQPADHPLAAGSEVLVPGELLAAPFKALLPAPAPPPAPSPGAAVAGTGSAVLEFGGDEQGRFAIYRLQPREALYSAVVVRFTGRLHGEDVNDLAREIARRNGIADVTDIPIGFPVKIPLDLLLPEFRPPDDRERLEYEARRRESSQFKNEIKASGLDGITIILDAGHGGADVGAAIEGAWESLYVYDIMLRVRTLLAERTHARVVTTTRDGEAYAISDYDILAESRGHEVLTHPPYPIADSSIGVHLRWYLANSVYRQTVAAAGDDGGKASERVIFISIHADSLHPSLRGATVYVPGSEKTGGAFGKQGPVFELRAEYKEQREISFSPRERVRSEGLSRELAESLVKALRANDLGVHRFSPVRDQIIRNRRAWVPAVLRYNAVPAKVLLEVCNLANGEDRALLLTRTFRQKFASAVVEALRAYYGESEASASATRAGR